MKKSYVIAIVMSVVITLWMLSGLFKPEQASEPATSTDAKTLMRVQAQIQQAQPVQLSLKVQGQVEPNRAVTIRSDIAGRIAEVLVEEGAWVKAGTLVVRLDIEDRQIQLAQAQAMLTSKEQAYKRAKTLERSNFQAKSAIEDAFAAFKLAQASVAQINLQIQKTEIRAPFDGIINARHVEQGGYVAANGEIASFVDNNPLVVVAPVSQQNIQQLSTGAVAEISFATGLQAQGTLRYISPVAQASTRTFRVELAVDNKDNRTPAGISAEVSIPTQEVTGHFVSPAVISLDDRGQMGIKTVNESDQVVFNPITIINATSQGAWVKGLPEKATIITVGQGFVEAGATVSVELKPSENGPSVPANDATRASLSHE
ncbi:MAG TPA: efflux RND transporter periplasmic adaptor subunit [Marinagarivorans sp.]